VVARIIDSARVREQLGLEDAERVIPTASMWPVIRPGDAIRFRRQSRAPRLGEIWVAERGSIHLVHRVLWVRGDGAALLKGDFLASTDGWIEPARLFGPVSAIGSDARWRPTNRRRDRLLGLGWSAAAATYLTTRRVLSHLRPRRGARID
jgi:hypothetical protein